MHAYHVGNFNCLEPIGAEVIAELIAVSTEGSYLYTTKIPSPESDEDVSEIESDGGDKTDRKMEYISTN